MRALHDHMRIRGFKPGPLFLSREGNGMSRVRLHELIKRYCALAGIPEKKAHMQIWKHSYGKHLAGQGADILEIQDQLGHRTVHTVMKYVGIKASRREAFAYRMKNWK